MVNPMKQHRKLMGLGQKAQSCLSRDEAQKLIRKAEKAHRKLREWLDGRQGSDRKLDKSQSSVEDAGKTDCWFYRRAVLL